MDIDSVLKWHGIGTGSGSNIKSIQKISTIISNTSQTVNIGVVNPSNSIVYLEFYGTIVNIAYTANVELTNSTTVTLKTYYAPSTAYAIGITVIEFNNVKSKQTGSYTCSSSWSRSYNIPISSVNTCKCIAIATFTCSSSAMLGPIMGYCTFVNDTILAVNSANGTGISGTLKWQLIEFL